MIDADVENGMKLSIYLACRKGTVHEASWYMKLVLITG